MLSTLMRGERCGMKRCTAWIAAFGLAAAVATGSVAQEQEQSARQLQGTLQKIDRSGVVTIGYREASFPLSYVDPRGQPLGYSIDLCKAIVDEIAREIDNSRIRIEFAPVTPETRIPALIAGKIDLECGSSSNTIERQKQVAFSPLIFVSGTKLMVKRASGIRSYKDLKGKVVVTTAGTTNEQVIKRLNQQFNVGMNVVTARDHEESYALVADGNAAAFATDDVLLYGLIARHRSQRELIVVGDLLSYDPYGIMFRKDDPQLNEAVLRTFRQLVESRDILELYHKWFVRRTPTGEQLNLPMGPQLEESFRVLGLGE
jgi:glutamate/aspartate transport system substrate-binding protein